MKRPQHTEDGQAALPPDPGRAWWRGGATVAASVGVALALSAHLDSRLTPDLVLQRLLRDNMSPDPMFTLDLSPQVCRAMLRDLAAEMLATHGDLRVDLIVYSETWCFNDAHR